MREDDRVFLLGEDIGAFGGAFGVTAGLLDEFGEARVIDTPIAEEGFVGAAIGAAWMGERPVVELQFADFITCAFDPIVTVAAKTHWRSGQPIPITIRCPTGGGVRGGPFHAGSPEGWFVGTAGLKIVCPGTVEDAYGLLRAAIDDPDPVLYFEHKRLYRTLRAEAPPTGLPHADRAGVDRARRHATRRSSRTAPASRPRSRPPSWSTPTSRWSTCARSGRSTSEAILASVEKTSRVLVLQEAARSTGAAGRDPLADRPALLRAARCTARPARAARHAGAVRARARGRVPAVGRLDGRRPRRAARLLMPIEPCAEAPSIDFGRARRAVPARAAAAPVRGPRAGALPPGPDSRLGVHGPRPGGGRRRRRARARPRRRRRAAQPRARLPLRARRDPRRRVPQLPRQGHEPDVRTRRQHAFRRARARRLPARLDARRPRTRRHRRSARVQAPRRSGASR